MNLYEQKGRGSSTRFISLTSNEGMMGDGEGFVMIYCLDHQLIITK